MEDEKYIQIGVTALRDPGTGEFLPAVPLYIRADDSAAAGEESLIRDIGALLAERMRRYIEGCKTNGAKI